MFNKFISFILVLLFAFSVTACSIFTTEDGSVIRIDEVLVPLEE